MRNYSRIGTWIGALTMASLLSACAYQQDPYGRPQGNYPAQQPGYGTPPPQQQQPQGRADYGRVSSIDPLQSTYQRAAPSGVGAVIGAVVGGVLGNQIGGGMGRAALTAAGAVGGAVAGNAIEGRTAPGREVGGGLYRISIQLDQGGQRVYDVPDPSDLRPGDRVRMIDGQISRY